MKHMLDGRALRSAVRRNRAAVFSLLLLCLCCGLLIKSATRVRAQDGHMHGMGQKGLQQEAQAQRSVQRLAIPDVEVLDERGQKKKFYTDLLKGKLVMINFLYTTCKDICPLSGDNFARMQSLLGERLGKDVYLLSVTTDPETDSPAKLKAWSERFKPKAGWTFVTGEKAKIETLLRVLSGEGPRRGYHTPVALLFNDDSGAWVRTYGLESPPRLIEMLDALSASAELRR